MLNKNRSQFSWYLLAAGLIFLSGFFSQEVLAEPAAVFSSPLSLSLDQASSIGLANNLDVQTAKYDAYIKRAGQDQAESVFDTYLNAGIAYYNDQSKSSSVLNGTKNTVGIYEISIEKKLPTGTNLEISLSDERNYTNSTFTSINPNHDAQVKVSVSQPLADNFFGMNDRGLIKISKLDIENSDYDALDRIENSLAELQKVYWLLSLRYHQLDIAEKMHERAVYYYRVFEEKNKLGLVEDAELYAQEANVLERKIDIETAKQKLRSAQNELLFALNEKDFSRNIIPQKLLEGKMSECVVNKSLQKAIVKRRDYKQAANTLSVKKINLKMKNNSVLPQIDLEASFAHNGLETDQSDAWKNISGEDNPEMYIGLNFSMPLENRIAKSEKKKAQSEKARAIIAMKKIEHKIIVEINNLVDAVNLACENAELNNQIVSLNRKKLIYEEKRFKSGRSQTDTLVRYQQEYLQAQNSLAQNLYEYKTALIDLLKAENSLLDIYWQGSI